MDSRLNASRRGRHSNFVPSTEKTRSEIAILDLEWVKTSFLFSRGSVNLERLDIYRPFNLEQIDIFSLLNLQELDVWRPLKKTTCADP